MDKKYIVSGLIVVLIAAFVIYEKVYKAEPSPVVGNNTEPSNSGNNNTTTQDGNLNNGQYTGAVVDAFFGPVQVKAVVAGGKLSDVQLLQYPNSAGYTSELSNKVLPQLKTEAIVKQSARVSIISGATQTSQAFAKSLQSALVQAGTSDNFNIEVTDPKASGRN